MDIFQVIHPTPYREKKTSEEFAAEVNARIDELNINDIYSIYEFLKLRGRPVHFEYEHGKVTCVAGE